MEVRCPNCRKLHLEGLEGKATWTCLRCKSKVTVETLKTAKLTIAAKPA
jgi:ribosomal protein L37AE/L43A